MPAEASPRIVLVLPTFPKLSETFIVRHALGMLDRGWDVRVLCRRFDRAAAGAHPDLARRPDFARRVSLETATRPRWRLAASAPRLAATWARRPGPALGALRSRGGGANLVTDAALARLRPDLVHFEFGSLAVERVAAARRLGARTVVSFRGFDLNFVGLERDDPATSTWHYRPVWQHADALHLLGRDLWRRARARGCPAERARALIPPAVDGERFRAAPRPEKAEAGPLRLVSVGRLEWKKGHDYSLRALAELLRRGIDARLEIVGDGALRGALAFSRHQLGLENRVELSGPLPPDEVRRRLERADLFLHLAVSEGFCNAVLEAQAMGLPVVTSDADGLSENVAHGITGLVVPRRDPVAAARALEELAGDPERRRRFARAGARRAREIFTPEAEIDRFDTLYRRVLEARGERLEGDLLA